MSIYTQSVDHIKFVDLTLQGEFYL